MNLWSGIRMGFFTKDFLILVCQTYDWETFKLETPPVHLQTPIGMILLLVGVDTSHIVVIKTVLVHISSISSPEFSLPTFRSEWTQVVGWSISLTPMFLLARPSVYAVPTRILHLKECHLLVILGMSTQESSVVYINYQSNCDCILVPLLFIRHFISHRTWHFAEGDSPRIGTRYAGWGQVEIRNSESLANGAIFP